MADFYTHGPSLTYVTDPALSLDEQQRVVRAFIRCASDGTLRVAFRLPDATDDDVRGLLEWYLRVEQQERADDLVLPPLIHNRPAVAAKYDRARLWMPAGSIGAAPGVHVFSVHDSQEVKRAITAGAGELVFGHVFASESHPGEPGRGVRALEQVNDAVERENDAPVVTAIGGIAAETIGVIAGTGVQSVACIRAISRSSDIPTTVNAMWREWQRDMPRKDMDHD